MEEQDRMAERRDETSDPRIGPIISRANGSVNQQTMSIDIDLKGFTFTEVINSGCVVATTPAGLVGRRYRTGGGGKREKNSNTRK